MKKNTIIAIIIGIFFIIGVVNVLNLADAKSELDAAKADAQSAAAKKKAMLDSQKAIEKADKKEKMAKAEKARNSFDLEVQNWEMTVGQEHLLCKGTVKNTSGKQLDYVQIVATYYDNKMKLVTSGETLIESQSLSKDQSSPFKVYTPYDEKL